MSEMFPDAVREMIIARIRFPKNSRNVVVVGVKILSNTKNSEYNIHYKKLYYSQHI